MVSQDQTLTCRDCGQTFTFTVGEQEFFAGRGFDNAPSRCPVCRAARKASRQADRLDQNARFGRGSREMHPAVCATCGKATEVPFQPQGDRPVYCSDCYSSTRGRR